MPGLSSVHTPVMAAEVLGYLKPQPGDVMVDCTVGAGGHSKKILENLVPDGKLIGIDTDKEILNIAQQELGEFKGNFVLIQGNFRDLDIILENLAIEGVDGLLFDLGVSSYQLESAARGFSFSLEGPLDMRMGPGGKSAYDLVNFSNKEELADIIFRFGQERYARRIAEAITRERRARKIETTFRLKDIILKAVPRSKNWQKIHPATRTFQALRIAVNDELGALEEALNKAPDLLDAGGRLCVISFHSLEDRIVKNVFRDLGKNGILKILTKKPVTAADKEIKENPRARSAKLRAALRT